MTRKKRISEVKGKSEVREKNKKCFAFPWRLKVGEPYTSANVVEKRR